MGKVQDLTGQKFGRLIVNRYVNNNQYGKACWECKCKCGKTTIVKGNSLKTGNTQSCGCLQVEKATKHNLSHHPLYGVWVNIIQRTTNPNDKEYKNYGARKIKIYDPWLKDPTGFIKYCERLPNWNIKGYSIDRINNHGNYEPGNIRFADNSTQMKNRRAYSNTKEKYIKFLKELMVKLKFLVPLKLFKKPLIVKFKITYDCYISESDLKN